MNPPAEETARHRQQRADAQADCEAQANALLTASLKTLGRGDYPFYTAGYIRRLGAADKLATTPDEADHSDPPPQVLSVSLVWKIARRARLSSIEMDVVRTVAGGAEVTAAASLLGMPRQRAARILKRAINKMSQHITEIEASFDEQIGCVLYEEQRRRGAWRESHCKRGQEACRRTGLCSRRWYVHED